MNVYRQGSQSIAPGASATLITYHVSRNQRFDLTHFANYANSSIAFGYVTWRIKINGASRYPFDAILDQMGSQNEPMPVGDEVFVQGGDVVTVEAENAAGSPSTFGVGAVLKGTLSRGDR